MATSAFGYDSFFSTTLSSAITSTDTTIPLVAAPTAQEGVLVIEPNSSTNREIIYYTSVSGNSVVLPSVGAGRGQEGTTAMAHSSGVTVKMNTTSRHFEVLKDGTGLADSAITTAKIADENVTSRKFAPTVIQESCTANTTVTDSTETDITGCTATFTPAIASVAKVTAVVSFNTGSVANDLFNVLLDVDGVNESESVRFKVPTSGGIGTLTQVWLVSLTAASHTLKLQGARVSGTGQVTIEVTHTKLLIELIGNDNVTDS